MALEHLLAIPAQQIEVLLAESWAALRRRSRFRDVPALAPRLGLIGEALLDRSFSLTTSVLTGVPLPDALRRALDDVLAARRLYEERGWLADPASYHAAPPPPRSAVVREASAWTGRGRWRYSHLRFESDYAPRPGEPGRGRWLAHPSNGSVHVYLLEHSEPRPWLVCVHGFAMGLPSVNFPAFQARHLHEELGLNLAFPVLPLHGPRSATRMSGAELLQPDYLRIVYLFAQACWDVRRTVAWLRERGDQPIALYGISLGAYVSALVASLEDSLECVIAGIPAVDFPNLARDNEPWQMRQYDDELRVDWGQVRPVTHVVSPLAMTPRLPPERRFIYAGLADRVVKPDQPRALWRHWGQPEIHWFSGGHVLGMFKPSVSAFVDRCLEASQLVRGH